MLCETCSYLTERLLVKEWNSLSPNDWAPQDLAHVVRAMLTSAVTRSLPPAWQGDYTLDRAGDWVDERDRGGTTLLALERSTRKPVGLVILYEGPHHEADGTEVRLGYLLSESAWGRGLASELVQGFVDWCRDAGVASIVGGVERENYASRRVLEKCGFVCDPVTAAAPEQMFELRLQPD